MPGEPLTWISRSPALNTPQSGGKATTSDTCKIAERSPPAARRGGGKVKKSDLKTLSGPRVSTCGLRGETPPGWPRPCRLLHDVLFSQAGSSGFRVPSTRGKGCSRCTQPEGNAIPGFDWSESRRRRSRQSDPRAGHRVLGPPHAGKGCLQPWLGHHNSSYRAGAGVPAATARGHP